MLGLGFGVCCSTVLWFWAAGWVALCRVDFPGFVAFAGLLVLGLVGFGVFVTVYGCFGGVGGLAEIRFRWLNWWFCFLVGLI